MTAKDIVAELKKLGNAQTKKTWMTHGAQEPCLGVKVEDMKKSAVVTTFSVSTTRSDL